MIFIAATIKIEISNLTINNNQQNIGRILPSRLGNSHLYYSLALYLTVGMGIIILIPFSRA
jgi:hypothetical protein